MSYESAIDRAIREATERGEFDNLPGAGKPLHLRNTGDPNWWLKDLMERGVVAEESALAVTRALADLPAYKSLFESHVTRLAQEAAEAAREITDADRVATGRQVLLTEELVETPVRG